MKIVATICVRMGSSRLPGKVMREINNKPLLQYLLLRLSQSKIINEIVVATSRNKENDIIEEFCIKNNYLCFRGDEDDVLSRILAALKWRNADVGVEIFGDCPLIDYKIVDNMINKFIEAENLDFLGNDLKTSYPPGMDVEVFSVKALEDSDKRTNDISIREHGTLFIRQNPFIYKIENLIAPKEYFYPDLELEIDTEEDLMLFEKIILYFNGRFDFTLDEIIVLLKNKPDWFTLNKNIPRRWKQFREGDA